MDERIRLEKLLDKTFGTDGTEINIERIQVSKVFYQLMKVNWLLEISPNEQQLLNQHLDQLKKWGNNYSFFHCQRLDFFYFL